MKAVGDLPGVGRTLADPLRIEPAAISAGDFNSGMALEPVCGRLALEHVRNRMALKIHDDRPVCEAFAPAPVVDCDSAQRFDVVVLADVALQAAAVWCCRSRASRDA
jgi:hypothetical protein